MSSWHSSTRTASSAQKVRYPLFVAKGANDPRVKQEESEQFVTSRREKNIPVEYLLKANEGHGFRNEENRFEFYHAMEAFFAKHLAPVAAN